MLFLLVRGVGVGELKLKKGVRVRVLTGKERGQEVVEMCFCVYVVSKVVNV